MLGSNAFFEIGYDEFNNNTPRSPEVDRDKLLCMTQCGENVELIQGLTEMKFE